MTDTPIDPTAPSNTQQIRKRRRNTAHRPLRINHRHRYMVELYVLRGMVDIAQCTLDAGLAHDADDAAAMGRNYLQRTEIIALIREELRTAGLTEARIKSAVIRWIDSDDPNASLRASELGARILGLLREPAPAVPQLPPLIVVQGVLPEADSGSAALPADYSIETPSTTHQLPVNETPGDSCQNGLDNPFASGTARVVTATARHAPAHEAHNELPPLINVSEKAIETPVEALKAVKPVKTRKPKPPQPKRGWRAYSETKTAKQ